MDFLQQLKARDFFQRLHAAVAAVCPIDGVSVGAQADRNTWSLTTNPGNPPSGPQLTAAAAVLASFSTATKVPRTLLAIYNDLVALTGGQKTSVWTNLTAGSPPLILTNTGSSADSIFLLWRIASNASLPAAFVLDGKLAAAAYYVRDNPDYLVHPTFDATLNISGEE